jgi:hypothetical protein
MKEQIPLNFEAEATESPEELAGKLKSLEHTLFDSKRIGGDPEYNKELKVEIESLEKLINSLTPEEREVAKKEIEPKPEKTKSPESIMTKEIRDKIKNGMPRSLAIDEILRRTKDKGRKVYLKNLFNRRIK